MLVAPDDTPEINLREIALQGAKVWRVNGLIGMLLCPKGAATAAAWEVAVDTGLIEDTDRCVLFNYATGLKYPMPATDAFLDRHHPIDWASLT